MSALFNEQTPSKKQINIFGGFSGYISGVALQKQQLLLEIQHSVFLGNSLLVYRDLVILFHLSKQKCCSSIML